MTPFTGGEAAQHIVAHLVSAIVPDVLGVDVHADS
jgi:hypothetical protein